MKYFRQYELLDLANLYSGFYLQFINEYDFELPTYFLDGVKVELPKDLEWRSDIFIDADYNLCVPDRYIATTIKDNSYADNCTGYYKVEDADVDVTIEYGKDISFKETIYPVILEWLREANDPAFTELVNATNKL